MPYADLSQARLYYVVDGPADAPALLDNIQFAASPMQAAEQADALVIVTEWKAYKAPHLARLKSLMKAPVIFDGRNLYEPWAMRDAGFDYVGIGRGSSR